jgi:hypothetical protein
MSKKRVRILKKGRGWGRHKSGEILHCQNCADENGKPKELEVGTDDIVSRMITSINSHTVYYCLSCAKELNIIK